MSSPDSERQGEKGSEVLHVAIKQKGFPLDYYIKHFFRGTELSVHHFSEFEELVTLSRRFQLRLILIAGFTEFHNEIELIQAIKHNVFLSIIPVVVYHPEMSQESIVAAYENGAEDVIYGEWVAKLVEVRLKRVITRSNRDLAVNASTRLPGPTMIEAEITRQIGMDAQFAACYADLDNFKAYNDYYGYAYGDKIIKLTGQIIRDVVFDTCREGFVGHIAGDDFICIVPEDLVATICTWIIRCFDSFIPYHYTPEDRANGYILVENRQGVLEKFPILTISIAVVCRSQRPFVHVGELSRMLAELKKGVKQRPGSNYLIDRRRR